MVFEDVSNGRTQFVPYLPRNAGTGPVTDRRILYAVYEGARPLKYSDDVEDRYLVGRAVEEVTPFSAALGLDDTAFVKRREYMLEVLLGDALSFRDVGKKDGRTVRTMYREVYDRPQPVSSFGRYLHLITY